VEKLYFRKKKDWKKAEGDILADSGIRRTK